MDPTTQTESDDLTRGDLWNEYPTSYASWILVVLTDLRGCGDRRTFVDLGGAAQHFRQRFPKETN